MTIDIDRVLASDPLEWDSSWAKSDVIRYHLGIGAGVPPDDAHELRYVYERDLVTLPTFGTVPGFMPIQRLSDIPGLDIDLRALLHAEHELTVHGRLPTSANATSACRPIAVHDLRVGAAVVFETTTTVEGQVLLTNTMTAFIKGEGGFGGDAGPGRSRVRAPRRDPDATVVTSTLPQQALWYRLSGDANPLHVDPEFATAAGFDKPILHGMCTFGMAGKAAVDALLDGDVSLVQDVRARFSGVVTPGETIEHDLWREEDDILIESRVGDRTVLKQARIGLRGL